jgi:hypothetical protein
MVLNLCQTAARQFLLSTRRRPSIIDARARYWAAARRLRNTDIALRSQQWHSFASWTDASGLGYTQITNYFTLVSRKYISEDCGQFSLILCRPSDKFTVSSIMGNFRLHLFDITEEFVAIILVRPY